jgi:uncharacterized repeat protein (TIGR03943 family)
MRLRHIIYGLATLLWGAVPIWLYAAGRIKAYLAPEFHSIALIGGLGMVVLGLFNILTSGENLDCGHDHGDHDHEHSDQNPLTSIGLMALPVVLSLLWTTDSYSASALARKGLNDNDRQRAAVLIRDLPPFTRESLDKYTPKTPEGHYMFDLTQLFWSAGDEELMGVFDGLPAEITGQLIEEDASLNPDGQRMRLYRVFMTCCAADAQVLGITVRFPDSLPDLPKQTWVKLRGVVDYETIEGQTNVLLQVSAPPVTTEDPDANTTPPWQLPGF